MGLDPITSAMQIGGGLISSISKLFLARKQRQLADQINPVRTYYQTSPDAIENKTLAQNQMNSDMAGANDMRQGIDNAQAGTINAASRNATSSADALAVAAGSQGTANNAYANLGTMQNQWKQQGLGNVMAANRDLTNEGDKVYQDKLMDYNEKTTAKNALLGSSIQNQYGAFSDIGNGMMMAGSMFGNNKPGTNSRTNRALGNGFGFMQSAGY